MRNQWFIIQTLSGQEHKVKDSIEKRIKTDEMQDFIKEVLVPMEKGQRFAIREGGRTIGAGRVTEVLPD